LKFVLAGFIVLFSLSKAIIMKDYYNDNGNLFSRIFSSWELPDFVRDSIETEKVASISGGGFADEFGRTLPIHSAADTYISAAYFAKQAADADPCEVRVLGSDDDTGVAGVAMAGSDATESKAESPPKKETEGKIKITVRTTENEKIASNILKAAALYGITTEVEAVMKFAASLKEKTAALVIAKTAEFEFESGVTGVSKIRGRGPDAVQKAAEFILHNQEFISVADLMRSSAALVKAAEDNGTNIDPRFDVLSGKLACNRDQVNSQLLLRLDAIDCLLRKEAGDELAAADDSVKLADFDKKYDLTDRYGSRILHPCDVFHSVQPSVKEASLAEKVATNLLSFGTKGMAYQAIDAGLGTEKAASLLRSGEPLTDAELSVISPYLNGQL
jgi:hypothetical protein